MTTSERIRLIEWAYKKGFKVQVDKRHYERR